MTTKKAKNKDQVWPLQSIPEIPNAWIQWKATDVFMDISCVCGVSSSVAGEFAYHVKCPACKRVFFCNGHIELIELEEEPDACLIEGNTA